MAVLSKAGCNLGTCHGNFNGKNGFKLSLRGQDPEQDWTFLAREQFGRRANPLDPPASLILRKALGEVPHEGGRRFDRDSPEYAILHAWIEQGMPLDPADTPLVAELRVTPDEQVLVDPADGVQLQVEAIFEDGTTRDVTRLAVFEPSNQGAYARVDGYVERQRFGETSVAVRFLNRQAIVQLAFMPSRPDFVWQDVPVHNVVDEHVFAKLKRLRIQPSALSSDSQFLRRAYLDALGVLPSPSEVREFLDDPAEDKRARLIDRLLERPEFADYWALKWSDLLRNEEKQIDRKGVQAFHHWMRQAIEADYPLDRFAHDLLASRGSTYRYPAANFYRGNRDPQTAAETTAQVFLGVRLQCARCHNHPFDQWSQEDYYSFSALFARVRYKILENNRRDRFDKHEFDGEQVVWMDRSGEIKDPRSGKPAVPRFLGETEPAVESDEDRLEALADWIASADNPYFPRMQANRIWYHLLGLGIIDPLDDLRSTNPPSNEALLDALTEEFVASGFRLKPLVRLIMNSRTYQLSSEPNETNADDERNFARAIIRPLEAEPLLDALSQVTEVPAAFNGYPLGIRAGQVPGVEAVRRRDKPPTPGEQFLTSFGKPIRSLTCECERSAETTLGQAFQMISGPLANEFVHAPENRLGRLLASEVPDEAILEELYLAALCRLPRDEERDALLEFVARGEDRRAAFEDILWGLISSKEFLLRR